MIENPEYLLNQWFKIFFLDSQKNANTFEKALILSILIHMYIYVYACVHAC